MITELHTVLEIALSHHGEALERFNKTIKTLREGSIKGHNVLVVSEKNMETVVIPGFGHNYRCQAGNCLCDVQTYGVIRYFGVYVWVDGSPDISIFDTYKLGDYARIEICGMGKPYIPGTIELCKP